MSTESNKDVLNQHLLEALLDSWDRNNAIMVGVLRALPAGGLEARATKDSPCVAQLFMHVRYARICTVVENVLEFAAAHPDVGVPDNEEWVDERDADRLECLLNESARVVRDAVKMALESSQPLTGMYISYPHPVLLLQHMLWHEGYHVGQMKLALKATGYAMTDEQAGPVTWGVWWSQT